MKQLLIAALGALFTLSGQTLSGQTLESFKAQLSQPHIDTLTGRISTITLREEGTSGESLRKHLTQNPRLRFKGWRVCIFSDNTADARSGAHEAMALFKENFPHIALHDEYASPYFRVSVGNCTTTEEAIILLARVKHLFPKAFVKQEHLTLADLVGEKEE